MNDSSLQTVLTGDIVLSEEMSRAVRRSIRGTLDRAAESLRRAGVGVMGPDVFRGDAWQMIVRSPADALLAAVYIRAVGLASSGAFDTRVAIGIGTIDDEGSDGVSSGFGPAFTASGRTLDTMPRDRRVQVAGDGMRRAGLVDALLYLLDRIMLQWTTAQARVVSMALEGLSQEEIGAAWSPRPISQQAVAQHLARASWHAIDQVLTAWRHEIDELVIP